VALAARSSWTVLRRTLATAGVAVVSLFALLAGFLVEWALAPPPISPLAWTYFVPAGQEYEVRMPGVPAPQPRVDFGVPFRAHTVHLPRQRAEFTAGCHDLQPLGGLWGWRQQLDRAEMALTRGRGARPQLVARRDLTLGNLRGREWVTRDARGGVSVVRLYAGRSRLYVLQVRGPRLKPDSADVRQFLDSFQPRGE
jgi:hypothetical protein